MASSGKEMERWAQRQGGRAGELVEPSDGGNALAGVKLSSSTDHLSHLPRRADSAYSSFSGGSNIPEYPSPPCHGENCSVPPEQAPYMDSEYVRGIYNLSAANSDLRYLHPDPSISAQGTSLDGGHTPTPGMLSQGLLPAPPPSPPARLDSYKVTRHLENSKRRPNSGATAPSLQGNHLAERDGAWSQHRAGTTEQEKVAARRNALESKALASADSASEGSVAKIQGLKTEENREWSPSQQPTKRGNPHIFSRPSSVIFQEYLKTDSVANVPKILSAYNSVQTYRIPGEMNPRSCHPVSTNPGTGSDAGKDKPCPCSAWKPKSREMDLQSPVPEPSQQCLLRAKLHSDLDQDVFKDSCDLKCTESALLIKNAPRKLNSCGEENGCCDSEGEAGRDFGEPLLSQQSKMQRPAVPCSWDAAGGEQPPWEGSAQGKKQCCDITPQIESIFRPKEDSTSQFSPKVQKENRAGKSSPDSSRHLEEAEPSAQKYHPELSKQLLKQLQDDLSGEQISRQTTPMLYYLSGGKATTILHPKRLTPRSEDSGSSPKEFPASSPPASARSLEIQRENHQLQGSQQHQHCRAGDLLAGDLIPGSPASSTDESFKNDYREKLKVAQRKVLRETSFKRKDLQMSLPVRLRQKPSKRPSIEHLRSFSLSSAGEDARPLPSSPSPLQSLESFPRDEEVKRPQAGRIGGRKRVTKEQKKLCYSEPEKLNQLADKEVPWSQVRDEISEQDIAAARRKTLENRGRALSSSGISRTELKQIQQSALMEYMERKRNQRAGGSQHLPLHQPPQHKRLSHPKWAPGKASNPQRSRELQTTEVFCPLASKETSPEGFPPLAFVPPRGLSSRSDPSSAPGTGGSEHNLGPQKVVGSCTSKRGASASGRAQERPRSTPPSTQDTGGGVGGAVTLSQSRGSCLGPPSSCDPEKVGCKNPECKDNSIPGDADCQGAEDLNPETSVLAPGSGTRGDAGVEEGSRRKSLDGKDVMQPGEPAAPWEQGTSCPPALAQPPQGDKNATKGSAAKQSSQGDLLPRRDWDQPSRRAQSPEDQRCQELAMEIVAQDSSLGDILMPHPLRKSVLDLMEGLFPGNVSMLDKSHRKKGDGRHAQENDRKSSRDATEECPESEHDAKQRSGDPTSKANQVLSRSRGSTKDLDDITSKKLELISRLRWKLQNLWEEREVVLGEAQECARRGEELEALVQDICKPNECQRYLMFIGDLEKVLSLLLCLSSRLARVQDAMRRMDGNADAEEKHSLNERHKLLSRQREDAKDLKENLDRRERVVFGILAKYLTEQQLQDYQHFVQLKTSLLIEQKDLEEQIKFFKEQLENLEKSIPL
ncbi:protein Shroom1 isoform X1 [Heliangelus exortis]|uniref:protein Shroom1 isoform X1 n=1 Tax=Heliangelus exortis TaxID=472823 RepID=UPI003A8ED1F8